ncbi:glutamate ligase domain-containing protein, partial [Frankia sp. AgKG'84/4]|uniref:glutamate ligase domain-containing protein n=1 Tax=Frankia sp. AgKG'84/4 TaxID=573490 RepID=UPI002542B579
SAARSSAARSGAAAGVTTGLAPESLGAVPGQPGGAQTGTSADADPAGTHSLEVIDDYAHHPTEIRLTLAAARSRARDRALWAVLQPHTYSRFAAMLDGFADAFADADRVYVTDVYAAREHDDLGRHPSDLVTRLRRPAFAVHVPWPELTGRLAADVRAALADTGGDAPTRGILLLTLGAGTITTVGPRLLATLGAGPAG